jgi:hypothetical protein
VNRTGTPVVRLDRVALFPGALLAVRERWQPVLDGLPVGEVLVQLPAPDSPVRPTLSLVAAFLRAMGHQVAPVILRWGMRPCAGTLPTAGPCRVPRGRTGRFRARGCPGTVRRRQLGAGAPIDGERHAGHERGRIRA